MKLVRRRPAHPLQAAPTVPSTSTGAHPGARTGARTTLRWSLAVAVLAASTGLAAPAVASAGAAATVTVPPGTVASAAASASPVGLQVEGLARQVTLRPALAPVAGITDALGLSQARVVFTSATDATRQWVFALPATTVGALRAPVVFDRLDPGAVLDVVSHPADTTAALPDGDYVVQLTTSVRTLLGSVVDLASEGVAHRLTSPSRPGSPTGLVWPAQATAAPVVSWVAPASDGGATIEKYVVTAVDAAGAELASCTASAPASTTCRLDGLLAPAAAQARALLVVAVNSAGQSVPAVLGVGAAEPEPDQAELSPPDAPAAVAAVPGDRSVTVSWSEATARGLPVTGYVVRGFPGGFTRTVGADVRSVEVGGLTNGAAYTFTVTALAGVLEGTPSQPTSPTTPATTPGAPVWLAPTAGFDSATLRWNAPADDGGAGVTGYRVTIGGREVDTAATSTTVAGLAPSTTYLATVAARNRQGLGATVTQQVRTTAAPRLTAAIGATAKRSGRRAALVRVDLSRGATVVVRVVRGKTVTSRRVALGADATWVSLPLTARTKRLANGRRVTFEVRQTDGSLVASVRGRVRR